MSVRSLRFVLGDQLSPSVSSLAGLDPATDRVLMAEVTGEATYVRHHPKKIAFLFSAMRHFAAGLEAAGVALDYVRLDDPGNSGTLRGELLRAVGRHRPDRIVVTFPGEWRVSEDIAGWQDAAGVPVEIREDDRFFSTRAGFARWARGRTALRMEFFYRDLRRRTGLLMDGDAPLGGRWNFDAENRKPLPKGLLPPAPLAVAPDAITEDVLDLVERRFPDHFGELRPFRFAVTAADAARAFDRFRNEALQRFGDFQDAMKEGEDTLFHALIALYLNCGLLDPKAVCAAVDADARAGRVPLNAAEGFIRQILGWREYVRGLYWLKMPAYASLNRLGADRPLPAFFWTGDTDMNCLAQAIGQTRREAYAHHIQRLMVIGNFALLAGLDPRRVQEWFLAVYADAYEWVELPNVNGMALFADGGIMASKPYAASGKYIHRMSDYCGRCRYAVSETTGPNACPFNALYWDFLMRHRATLAGNPRLGMPYATLGKMPADRQAALRRQAAAFLDGLVPDGPAPDGPAADGTAPDGTAGG